MASAGRNAAAFEKVSAKLTKLAKVFPAKVAEPLPRGAGLVAARVLIETTPRDTGMAQSGWHATIGFPGGYVPSAPEGKEQTIARATAVLATAPPFSFLWISNNVPHAGVLENGLFVPPNPGPSKASGFRKGSVGYQERRGKVLVSGGYSLQAPQGMTIHALEAIDAQFDRLFAAAVKAAEDGLQ